jgi:hypothetical protein
MWRGHRARLVAAVSVLILAVSSLVTFAVLSDGNPVRQLDVHDSGIWVTNDLDGFFGRVNKAAGSIDTYFTTPGGAAPPFAFDIRQDRGVVVAWDRSGGRLLPVDVDRGVAVGDRAVPAAQDSQLELRGGTLAILDPKSGKVRASRYGADAKSVDIQVLDSTMPALIELGAANPASTGGKTAASVGGSLAMTVGLDGSVYAASSGGKLVTVRPTASGFETPVVTDRSGGGNALQLSAVGTTVVALDGSTGTLWIGDRSVSLGEPDPATRLQQPGPAADVVMIATSKGLFSVPIGDGDVRPLFAAGTGAPAAPTRLGPCVYAAWAGTPGALARSCDNAAATPQPLDRQAVLQDPVFRVNRDQLVLNDASTGRVFDIDTARSLDNWDQIQEAIKRDNANTKKAEETPAANKETKPKADDDSLGARPGKTTILHVLDNDADPAGRVLSIVSVSPVEQSGVSLTIAPDRQSLLLALPAKASDLQFTYTVDNGTQATAQAQVSVDVRVPSDNGKPTLRAAYEPKPFTVVAGRTLSIPVTDDWRDPEDGDPVQVVNPKVADGVVAATPDGKIDFTPPPTGKGSSGPAEITYQVSDGVGEVVDGKITVTVLEATAPTAAPAITQPDVVQGLVDVPLVIRPLDNDLPGADPSNANAVLALAGTIAPKDNLTVDTELKSGKVTVTADKAGSYLLDYQAAFGGAAFAPGVIRVDIVTPPEKAAPPVTMPDFGAVRGQVPVMVDVLANDVDPSGGLLTVVSAKPDTDSADAVQVDVVRGRWLRVTPTQDSLGKGVIVRYEVSNGSGTVVPGDVTVVQLPAVSPDPPRTKDDYATVRDGDTALITVLDNDSTESGAFLHLASNITDAPNPGQLQVFDPASAGGSAVDLGKAYVSRDAIRYVAPAKVDIPRTVRVEYTAENDAGVLVRGNLYVTVNPQPSETSPDQAPQPEVVEGRATSGDTIEIPVPTSGIDPDGDSTTVVAVGAGAKLGRILGISPTSITYQAYPVGQGTDQFTYVVTDRYGKTGSAIARVSVVAPGAPLAPVAVPDTVIAKPGATVVVNVLANDLVAPSDPATVLDLPRTNPSLPQGASLKSPTGPIETTVQDAKADAQVIAYSLTNSGGDSAPVPVTIRSQEGYNNPPVAIDDIAKVEAGATSTTVNVVEKDYDVDGPESALKVTKVALAAATISGGSVTLPVTPTPQVIPYEITDADGVTGTAVIFVPGAGSGLPFVKAGKTIAVPQNGKVTVDLGDYVGSPAGRQVQATTSDKLAASPETFVGVTADSSTKLTVSGLSDYIGPGAITLEVMDGTSLTDPNGKITTVTIPVQVGDPTPVLRCPTTPIGVYEGGSPVVLNITAMCHVWTPTLEERSGLRYAADWQKPIAGVKADGSGEAKITVTAASSAVPGSTGELKVTVAGSKSVPAVIPIEVLALPKASFAAVNLDGIQQGTAATVQLAKYVRSRFVDPVYGVVSVTPVSGMPSTETHSGGTLTITPGKDSFGTMVFKVVATDVADLTRTDRHVTGTVTITVFGVPDKPGTPQIGTVVQSRAVNLSWTVPDNHGAPIDQYKVTVVETGQTQTCQASPCNITAGLVNGNFYHFKVQAHNKAGWGLDSDASAQARPDQAPTAVTNFKASNPADHTMTLTWNAVGGEFSAVKSYRITWSGGGGTTVGGSATTATANGLVNNNKYDFTIVAINDYSAGPPASTQGQSSGAPGKPAAPTVSSVAMAGGASAAVHLAWPAVDPNGPGPVTYTVNRTGGSGPKTVCSNVTATSCNDDGVTYDGTTYQYAVTATNATGGAAHTTAGSVASFKAIGTPLSITTLSAPEPGSINSITVNYTTVAARGASSTVKIYEGGTLRSSKTESPNGGQSSSQTFAVSYDGNSHGFTAVVCNETACGTNSNAASQKPYTNPSVSAFDAYTSGNTVLVNVSANGGGRPVHLSLTNDGGWSHAADFTDNYSTTLNLGDVGWSYSSDFYLALTDSSGRGRPAVNRGPDHVTTPPPPPPPKSVTAWKGGSSPSSGCTYYATGGACPYIMASTSGFSGVSYTCSSYVKPSAGTYKGQTIFIYTTAAKNGDFSGSTLSWTGYPGEVWVNCGGVDSPHVAW